MKLNQLPKTTSRSKKRVGRGYGSGKGGHTSGRGQKGQKTRSKPSLMFEGTKMRKSLIRRLPMRRGKERFKSFKQKPIILNVKYLNLLKSGSEVTVKSLIKNGLVDKDAEKVGVKILGDGQLEKKLSVKLPVSKGAKKKIEKTGGEVVVAKSAKKDKAQEREKFTAKTAKKKPEKKVKKPAKTAEKKVSKKVSRGKKGQKI